MKFLFLTLFFSVSIFGSAMSMASKAYQDKDYKTAIKYWKPLAQIGDPVAQYSFAKMYYKGEGVKQNYIEAAKLFKSSAKQGHELAQYALGVMYSNGLGVSKNYKKALTLYNQSAKQGNHLAQYNLGFEYQHGENIKQDYIMAIYWYEKSADSGNTQAQLNLGLIYVNIEKHKNHKRAFELFKKASITQIDAQKNLGDCYKNGIGIDKDKIKSMFWYSKAANNDNAEAQNILGNYYLSKQKRPTAYKYWSKSAKQGNVQAKKSVDKLCKRSPWACK